MRTHSGIARRGAGAVGIALVWLVSVVCAGSLAAEEDPLVVAVRAKDVAKVDSLIKQRVDVNAYRGTFPQQTPTTPLYGAVDTGNVQIVTALLDAGADVSQGRDDPEASFGVTGPVESATMPARLSPLGLAVLKANADIVSLLIARRAQVTAGHLLLAEDAAILRLLRVAATPAVLRRYAALRFSTPIMEGDAAALRQGVRDPELAAALRGLGQDINVLLAYSYAGAAFREVIRASGPPEIASGSSNLLDRLLSGGVEIGEPSGSRPARGLDRWLTLPLATTFLRDEKAPFRYAEASAFDGDPATSWVEGVDGPGIHQKIAFALPSGASTLTVLPGYGDQQYFALNNRVRKARLAVYELWTYEVAPGPATGFAVTELGAGEIELEDVMKPQGVPLPALRKRSGSWPLIVVLEILAVYAGSRWDDTCLAEVGVLDASGRALAVPAGPVLRK